jgi:hypothetical protein
MREEELMRVWWILRDGRKMTRDEIQEVWEEIGDDEHHEYWCWLANKMKH